MNPAEFMLDAIGAGTRARLGERDWGEIWRDSPEYVQVKEELERIKEERLQVGNNTVKEDEKEYATPFWHQLKVVNARTHRSFWRMPNYGFTRLFNHVILALITGFAFFQLDDSRSSLQYRVFIMFQVTVMPALILAQVEPRFEQARLIYWRESFSKAYSHVPFALSMVLAEMPYSVICAVGFFLPLYYLPGLQRAPDRAGYQFLMMLVVEVFSVTLGQMISSLTPNSYIAVLLNPPIFITFALFCGVTIPGPQIPTFWRSWLFQLDPYTRIIGGMVVTELGGEVVHCAENEFNRFTAPPGQSCGEYMSAFFERGGRGYLRDNASSLCEYCAYKMGDEFFEPLGFAFENRWRDLGIMAAFIGSNLILLFLGSRYLNFNRR
jgi:ABC-type multidrug transport system permease subunit